MPRTQRKDDDYVIEAALHTLKVLEALEGANFEAVPLKRIEQRTGFSTNFCFRALKTLKVMGYARETPQGWKLGARLLLFSQTFNTTIEPQINAAIAASTGRSFHSAERNENHENAA